MFEILTLAYKDLRLLLRDRAGFFFTIFWPLIIAIFFGSIFGGGGGGGRSSIPILIVDEDNTTGSQAFIQILDEASEIDIQVVEREVAVDNVRRGKFIAYVALRPGFGEASENLFWGDPPTAELGVDPARNADAAMVEGILMKYASSQMQDVISDPMLQRTQLDNARESLDTTSGMPPDLRRNLSQMYADLDRFFADGSMEAAADSEEAGEGFGGFQPLLVERQDVARVRRPGPSSPYAISFPQGIIWGLIAVTASFGISLVAERNRGTLIRLQVAPISRTHILGGTAVACFISTICIAVGLFIIARIAFGVVPRSIPLLALAILTSSMCFVGIMMLLSVLGKTEQAASGISWAVLILMSMLGGGMIPLIAMPSWMRPISHISPVKWAVLAMEGGVWRDLSFAEMLQPCGILLAVGIVCFAVGTRAFKWTSQIQ
jgi:ABC-2 type transport system permease protein